jgi:uncharacterized protein (TIGR00730 family)
MRKISRVCVNCGSTPGLLAEYREAARRLGEYLAGHGIDLVFGGADAGLMGVVANAALASGGRVIGVAPRPIADKVGHHTLTELHIVGSMHERKQKMFDLSDAFIALPGGMGTLEELFELLTWAQLGMHAKPCGLLNVAGYYDLLLGFLDHCVQQRFIKSAHRALLMVGVDGDDLLAQFRQFQPATVEKWIDRQAPEIPG